MKSILLLCAVVGAISDASKCQADENSLLQVQGRNTMRKTKTVRSKDAKAMVIEMREIANSLVEGSDSAMSEDDLTDALEALHAQLTAVREATLQQVANAQQQMIDASGGFQACTTEELTGIQESVEQRAAAVESCQSSLAQLRTAEAQQCATAEDCLCDEARVRTTDKEALCASVTETYEAVFCEQDHRCTSSQQCHFLQAEVYQRLAADVRVEIGLIVEEYTAVEQAICTNRLTREAMTGRSRQTVIPQAALDACDDVDLSALDINYPAAPAPPTCPLPPQGGPQCWSRPSGQFFRNLIGSANFIGNFVEDAEVSGAGGNFLTRSELSRGVCASRVIRAHVQGGSCGDATVQFRMNNDIRDYFKYGRATGAWTRLTDVTVVSGEVAHVPTTFIPSRGGWILGTRVRGRQPSAWAVFASSYVNPGVWVDQCNSNSLQGGERVTLECVGV